MAGPWGRHLQDNLKIDKQIIHNLAHLLYSNGNRSCFGHPSCHLSHNRQLSGVCPSSRSILASDPTQNVHTKIYSLNIPIEKDIAPSAQRLTKLLSIQLFVLFLDTVL